MISADASNGYRRFRHDVLACRDGQLRSDHDLSRLAGWRAETLRQVC